jgi:hypothetical protein
MEGAWSCSLCAPILSLLELMGVFLLQEHSGTHQLSIISCDYFN